MAMRKSLSHEGSYVPVGIGFSDARLKEISKKLNIERRATENGTKNEPSSKATGPDDVERSIIDVSQGFLNNISRRAERAITEFVNAMRQSAPARINTKLVEADMTRKARETLDVFGDSLVQVAQERHRKHRQLRAFEEQNGRAPLSAIYSRDTTMWVSTLSALGVGESLANAVFFQELQTGGYVGGFGLAAGTSLVNLAIGIGTGGLGWRLMSHRKSFLKALGLLTTSAFSTAALALHLALGSLRERITHDPNAQIDFMVILRPSEYFSYSSIPPFVVFSIGVATFLVAALKGRGGTWGIVAPYFGHDVYDRRFRQADSQLQEAIENIKSALQNAYDSHRKQLRAQHASDQGILNTLRRQRAEAHAIARTLGDSIKEEIARATIWLQSYRNKNKSVRDTEPPVYFDEYPTFDEWQSQRLNLGEVDALIEEAEETLAVNTATLTELEVLMLEAQTTAIDSLLDKIKTFDEDASKKVERDDEDVSKEVKGTGNNASKKAKRDDDPETLPA